MNKQWIGTAAVVTAATLGVGFAMQQASVKKMGKQANGTFVVSSGQSIEPGTFAFEGRLQDLALHPEKKLVAVAGPNRVFLMTTAGALKNASLNLGTGVGFHGIVWAPDGKSLFVSMSDGSVRECLWDGAALTAGRTIKFGKDNARPGGMAITKDGKTLFVALMDKDSVAEIELGAATVVKNYPTQKLPFDVKLSGDETTLVVSNWAGRPPTDEDKEEDGERGESNGAWVVTDPRGFTSTGSVSLVTRSSGETVHLPIGLHPNDVLVNATTAYVANTMSDSISVVDLVTKTVTKTWLLRFGNNRVLGAMPGAMALANNTLYVACGGENAVAEVEVNSGSVRGYRPAGYYPMGVLALPENKLVVLNTKGNGSVENTTKGKTGNAHDFQGTISVVDTTSDLKKSTARVAELSGWTRDRASLNPKLKVYNGAIQHVLYIIKENRTYDEVFGDMKEGNGDPKICGLGETVTPNHHALARAFTLFDNGYVSGTNSADGHNWTDSAIANTYLEHEYTGYRTYPDCGEDPMGVATTGFIWDAALKKKKTVRVYGEFCDENKNQIIPAPKDWTEVYNARGTGKFTFKPVTNIPALRKLIHPQYLYWPLLQSDQEKADIFIKEYKEFSAKNSVPNLMVLSLPSDHTEGGGEKFPKPKSMVADNDLALGRIVDAVSHSPQWKNTAIFVIEDDAQAGPDHVDGHRTVYACYSPYTRRGFVDSSFYTTVSMLRSIELMLGLDPMTRFDATTTPLAACFTDTPNYAPYTHVPNKTPLGDMNPKRTALSKSEQRWYDLSASLDWSHIDAADPEKLNRYLWHNLHGDVPYPTR